MKANFLFFTFLLFFCTGLVAQISSEVNGVGSKVLIQSDLLAQEREIQVYLPDNYVDSEREFPVLYVLDGQRYFLHAVSIQKTFVEFQQTPACIVVGISKLPTDRNRNYSTNSRNYRSFIKDEVINYIDSEYRTSKDRILFGWAYAGGFVFETLIKDPSLFAGYIAASPFPVLAKVEKVDSLIKAIPNLDKQLFFTSGANEGSVHEGTTELAKLLTEKVPPTMKWDFQELFGEEHRSTPFTTLYRGMKSHFEYYPELQFNTLEEFTKAGGLPYVYEYYDKRATSYGFSSDVTDWTMFSIVRNAMRANNFEEFNTLVNEFRKTNFIDRLRVPRACSIAEFYLENNKIKKARELFTKIIEKNHTSQRALLGMGNTYKAEKKDKMAKAYFQKAEEVAKTN